MALYRRSLGHVAIASEPGSGERVQDRGHGHCTAAAKWRERNALPLNASSESISTASFLRHEASQPAVRTQSHGLTDEASQQRGLNLRQRRGFDPRRRVTASEDFFFSRWNDGAAGIVNRPGGASIWHSGLRRRRVGKACCVALRRDAAGGALGWLCDARLV